MTAAAAPPSSALVPRLFLIGAGLLWSTAGVLIKGTEMTAWQVGGGRSLVAALTLWLLFPSARRRPTRDIAWVAVAYAFLVVSFVVANKLTTAANAIFLQDSAPLYVLVLSPWFLGERPSRAEWVAAPFFGLGVLLFFADKLQPGQMSGNMIALASGVAFAFSIMGLRQLRERAVAAVAWGNLVAALGAAPLALSGPAPGLADSLTVLFLGVFQLGCAYALFVRGLRDVSAAEASLLALLEPVASALWAFLFLAEQPGPWAITGATLVLLATAWRTVAGARGPVAAALPAQAPP